MSQKIFQFDPSKFAADFARDGYVHIKGGVTPWFHGEVVKQVEESLVNRSMKEYAIGDKKQAMYEFPEGGGGNFEDEVCMMVSKVVGEKFEDMVFSERHVKAYDAAASATPLAHKDRYASQYSVGLSVHVKPGSTLVIYPEQETDINPFNTSVQMRSSLSPDRMPEAALSKARKVEIKDAAGDLIVFRGHAMWHLRANPALTTMLYFKMNAYHCDPLGEDRHSQTFRDNTIANAESGDEKLAGLIPRIGRRVDHFHKFYNRDWREIPGVVLFNEKHFSLDQDEFKMVQAMDGKKDVAAIVRASETTDFAAGLGKIRRMARRGVIDLIV